MLNSAKLSAFLPTTDAARSREFYEQSLGLRFIQDDGFALVFDANGTPLRISRVPTGFIPAPFTVLGWEVSDIDATLKDLAKAGIEPLKYPFLTQDGQGVCTFETGDQVAWFHDPDGNTLSIAQHVHNRPA